MGFKNDTSNYLKIQNLSQSECNHSFSLTLGVLGAKRPIEPRPLSNFKLIHWEVAKQTERSIYPELILAVQISAEAHFPKQR